MLKQISTTAAAILIATALLTAQRPATTAPVKPAPAEQTRAEQPPPARGEQPRQETVGQPTNIKLELTISDQVAPGEPIKKTVTMIVADRQSGSIRSRGNVRVGGRFEPVTINLDARPILLRDGAVRVELGLEYQPRGAGDPARNQPATSGEPLSAIPALEPASSNLNQRMGLILESGKPLVISQAADPATDRRITVELKATIMK